MAGWFLRVSGHRKPLSKKKLSRMIAVDLALRRGIRSNDKSSFHREAVVRPNFLQPTKPGPHPDAPGNPRCAACFERLGGQPILEPT